VVSARLQLGRICLNVLIVVSWLVGNARPQTKPLSTLVLLRLSVIRISIVDAMYRLLDSLAQVNKLKYPAPRESHQGKTIPSV